MRLKFLVALGLLVLAAIVESKGGFGGGARGGFSGARGSVGRAGGAGRGGGFFGGGSARAGSFRNFNAKPSWRSGVANGRGSYAHTQSFKSSFAGGATSTNFVRYRGMTPIIYYPHMYYLYGGHSYLFVASTYHNGRRRDDDETQCRLPMDKLTNLPSSSADSTVIISNLTIDEPTENMTTMPTVIRERRDENGTLFSIPTTTTTTVAPQIADELFTNLKFENGTRPAEMIWRCGDNEVCCGTECCPIEDDGQSSVAWIVVVILIGLMIFACCANANKEKWSSTSTYATNGGLSGFSRPYGDPAPTGWQRTENGPSPYNYRPTAIPMPPIPEKSRPKGSPLLN